MIASSSELAFIFPRRKRRVNSTILKRLFSAIQQGRDADVAQLCEKIIAEEKRLGHQKVAKQLSSILHSPPPAARPPTQGHALTTLPTSRRDSSPLLQSIPHEQLRHHMVVPTDVEARFLRIEKEYAARARLATYGLRPRNRILLHGPPGCGKSLGAERLAWATGLSLQKVRFDTLLSSYFGETAANLRKIFDAATTQPCALFLDECDTIARARGDRNDVGEVSRIVNMLLQLLEEFRGDGIVIAATNLDDTLDPALFRRFDEVLEIPKPGDTEIVRLLKLSFSSLETEKDFPWNQAAVELQARSCSEIVTICQNAAKRSVLASRHAVTWKDFEGAMTEQRRVA
ncbi:MAG: ATP-binding protein [Verrucomicrobia bacterium]|nr:ATP-binding protein [Verrucomicrobiota bacterium]